MHAPQQPQRDDSTPLPMLYDAIDRMPGLTAAERRVLRYLAPRGGQETPHEYLRRALGYSSDRPLRLLMHGLVCGAPDCTVQRCRARGLLRVVQSPAWNRAAAYAIVEDRLPLAGIGMQERLPSGSHSAPSPEVEEWEPPHLERVAEALAGGSSPVHNDPPLGGSGDPPLPLSDPPRGGSMDPPEGIYGSPVLEISSPDRQIGQKQIGITHTPRARARGPAVDPLAGAGPVTRAILEARRRFEAVLLAGDQDDLEAAALAEHLLLDDVALAERMALERGSPPTWEFMRWWLRGFAAARREGRPVESLLRRGDRARPAADVARSTAWSSRFADCGVDGCDHGNLRKDWICEQQWQAARGGAP